MREIAVDKLPFYAQRLCSNSDSTWDPSKLWLARSTAHHIADRFQARTCNLGASLYYTESLQEYRAWHKSCNLPCRVNVTVDAFLDSWIALLEKKTKDSQCGWRIVFAFHSTSGLSEILTNTTVIMHGLSLEKMSSSFTSIAGEANAVKELQPSSKMKCARMAWKCIWGWEKAVQICGLLFIGLRVYIYPFHHSYPKYEDVIKKFHFSTRFRRRYLAGLQFEDGPLSCSAWHGNLLQPFSRVRLRSDTQGYPIIIWYVPYFDDKT